jgi:hypothetical protein
VILDGFERFHASLFRGELEDFESAAAETAALRFMGSSDLRSLNAH